MKREDAQMAFCTIKAPQRTPTRHTTQEHPRLPGNQNSNFRLARFDFRCCFPLRVLDFPLFVFFVIFLSFFRRSPMYPTQVGRNELTSTCRESVCPSCSTCCQCSGRASSSYVRINSGSWPRMSQKTRKANNKYS